MKRGERAVQTALDYPYSIIIQKNVSTIRTCRFPTVCIVDCAREVGRLSYYAVPLSIPTVHADAQVSPTKN